MLIKPSYDSASISHLPDGTAWVECYNREGQSIRSERRSSSSSSSVVIRELVNRQWMMFVAVDKSGTTLERAWSKIYGPPSECVDLSVWVVKNNLQIHWRRPKDNGGDKVRYYRIRVTDVTTQKTHREFTTTHRAHFLRQVDAGVYTVQVFAANNSGYGPASPSSEKVEVPVTKIRPQDTAKVLTSTAKQMSKAFQTQHERKGSTKESVRRSIVNTYTEYAWALRLAKT